MVPGQWGSAGLLAVVLAARFDATTAPDPAPAPQVATDAKLLQKEEQARSKAAAEVATLARYAVSLNAIDEARSIYAIAIALAPKDEKLKAEVEKLRKKKNAPQKGTAQQIASRRSKALTKASELLAPAVAGWAEADRSDELADLVSLMRAQRLPVEPLAKYELVFFEPYLDWRRKKDVERLKAGWEIVDGIWCDKEKVASLDAAHSTWSTPWRIGDEVHEVRTTMPLRAARSVLATVASFRGFVLDYLAGEVDLQPPKGILPIVLTPTREEMERHLDMASKGARANPQAAAFYLSTNRSGNPCFVSFEMRDMTGRVTKVDMTGLRHGLLHEVAHQILFEYSKHAADNRRMTELHPWIVEGIAEFLPHYVLVDGAWVLTRPRAVPAGDGSFLEGPFGWCHDHAGDLKPIADFIAIPRNDFATITNYHTSCGLVAFLMEGKERAYRSSVCDLAELVHQAREKESSFAECFPGVDLKALDSEFRAYCREMKVDVD